MSDYLLEKSRVVSQVFRSNIRFQIISSKCDGEKNFHVFYLMFAGMSESELGEYDLVDAGEHG